MSRLRLLICALVVFAALGSAGPARALAGFGFAAESISATISGAQEGNFTLGIAGTNVVCKGATVTGSMAEPGETLTVTPKFTECTASEVAMTVTNGGCDFVFHVGSKIAANEFSGSTDLICSAEKAITVTSATCEAKVVGKNGLNSMKYVNKTASTPPDIAASATLKEIKYTVVKDGVGCPFSGTGEKSDGTLEGAWRLKGTSESGKAVALEIPPPSKLCQANEDPCLGATYKAKTPYEAKSTTYTLKVDYLLKGNPATVEPTCEAVVTGETSDDVGAPDIHSTNKSWTFSKCSTTCTITNASAGGLAFFGFYLGGPAFFYVTRLRIVCPAPLELQCQFSAVPVFKLKGGSPATMEIAKAKAQSMDWEASTPEENCPKTATFWGSFTFQKPASFWVTL
jgi:hypothetical protein